MTITMQSIEDFLPRDRLIAQHRLSGVEETPMTQGLSEQRHAATELVREGYLLHYGKSRYYKIDDPDLALLAGDRMYAAGLERLADHGDVEAVAVLAELIAGCAEAHGSGLGERSEVLWRRALAILARDSAFSS